jgi:L-threonylcarbamoyladenylate synthase
MPTVIRRFDCDEPGTRAQGLQQAAAALRRGDLVVLPTDTVYGLGADAFRAEAVALLLDVKGRGRQLPVPVLVGSPRTLDGLVVDLSEVGRELVDAFWPGALTLVCRHQPSLAWDLGDTRGTVAVRMPLHPVAIELLRDVGPMAVSSANRTGSAPATTVDEAVDALGEDVSVYLDGGPSGAAEPSSIVDLTGGAPRLLRAGALAVERLREVVPGLVVAP